MYKIVVINEAGKETNFATGYESADHAFSTATKRAIDVRDIPKFADVVRFAVRTEDGKPVEGMDDNHSWLKVR